MNERGTLWIIPDENQIMQPIYMKKVGEGISHTKEMLNMEFMNYQKIGGYSMRIIEDGEIVWKNLHGIEEVMREVKIKNSIYERKSEENASIKR